MSLFDGIQAAVFSTAENLFGDSAVWCPSNSELTLTEKVLFKNPNTPNEIGSTDKFTYHPYDYSFEYMKGQFEGLKEAVDGGIVEIVLINGFRLGIREVRTKFDGKTFVAYGEVYYD